MMLGSFISKRRKQLNISQSKFSELTNYSLSAISKIENNITMPSLSSISLIADALEISVVDLLLLNETPLNTTIKSKPIDVNIVEKNFKTIRINKNYSQRDFAEIIGVSRPTLAKIEACETSPSIDALVKVSSTFDISLNELLYSNLSSLVSAPVKVEKIVIQEPQKKFTFNRNAFASTVLFFAAIAMCSLPFLENIKLSLKDSEPTYIGIDDTQNDPGENETPANMGENETQTNTGENETPETPSQNDTPDSPGETTTPSTPTTTTDTPVIDQESNYFYLGSYPQTLVKDEITKKSLDNTIKNTPIKDNDGWSSYGKYFSSEKTDYILYKDIEFNDDKYRAIYITKNRLSSAQDQTNVSAQARNGYLINKIYYFKYEPLKWNILEKAESSFLAISNLIIDASELNNTLNDHFINGNRVYSNNFAYSTYKNEELNGRVYNWIFNDSEKDLILDSYCDDTTSRLFKNNDDTMYKSKLFLASLDEGDKYNLRNGVNYTDYAVSQGISTTSKVWWSRTADYKNYYGDNHPFCHIFLNDDTNTQWVTDTEYGIRPMANFKITVTTSNT